jgi:hypothetical protein
MHLTTPSPLSLLAIFLTFIACADNPTSETAFRSNERPLVNVATAPKGHAGDKPFDGVLVRFPEFFPDGVKHAIPLDEIFHGANKDGIPALTNPQTIPAVAADYLNDTDLVLGIAQNGESRAYPLRILNFHEIVNDTLGGRPIVVTFCPLCGTGIGFDPIVDGAVIEFGVSGLLYNNDLLMYDRGTQTPSLWVQAIGEAVVGPQTGALLDLLPITQAEWGEWKTAHPDTTVLSPATGFKYDYESNPYTGYESTDWVLIPLAGGENRRISRKTKVLGLCVNGVKKAYVLDELRSKQVVNDEVAGVPIVLIASAISDSVRVYERENRRFFGRKGEGTSPLQLVEIGTNDVWELKEDSLVHPKIGDSLARIPNAFVSFWFAWFQFHPDTLFYEAPVGDGTSVGVHPSAGFFTTWGEIK